MEKRYPGRQEEEKLVKLWQDKKVYNFDKDLDKKVFSVDTPPPTVSGSLHIGHVFLTYTLTLLLATSE